MNGYEVKEGLLHSKIFISDHKYLNLGSMNNDRWSWQINNELNLLVNDERDVEAAQRYCQSLINKARKIQRRRFNNKQQGYWQKIKRMWPFPSLSTLFWIKFLYFAEGAMSKSQSVQQVEFIEQRY